MAQTNINSTIEPFRKGNSFGDWIERLGFFFNMNKVPDEEKRDHFITLSGPTIFRELKLLYPNSNLAEVPYKEMVDKLKARLDKTESDLVQRLKFNVRVQQPDESLEDFVLSVKLQAEFCNFENFKQMAIRDRIVAGVRDKSLQQRLLNEEKLTLETAEKLIATWEIARNNAKNMDYSNSTEQIASLKASGFPGARLHKLATTMEAAARANSSAKVDQSRGPVKSRLGYSPYKKDRWQHKQWQTRSRGNGKEERNRPDYSQMVCDFCGVKGHIKRRCFKLKNMQRDAVNMIDPDTSGSNPDDFLSNMVSRMRADSDSENDAEGEKNVFKCMHVLSIGKISDPCLLSLKIENVFVEMEVDCGSSVTVMSKQQYFEKFSKKLTHSQRKLVVVNGTSLVIEGEVEVLVHFKGISTKLKLLILNCENNFTPLLGRPWLDVFFPDWRTFFVNSVGSSPQTNQPIG